MLEAAEGSAMGWLSKSGDSLSSLWGRVIDNQRLNKHRRTLQPVLEMGPLTGPRLPAQSGRV